MQGRCELPYEAELLSTKDRANRLALESLAL
jgi:hypothetical protein